MRLELNYEELQPRYALSFECEAYKQINLQASNPPTVDEAMYT